MQILWTKPANADLDSIEAYIASDNPKAAARVALRIIDVVETVLPDHPHLGKSGRIFGTRELVISNTPYMVVYAVRQECIAILRILHCSQKWPNK